MWRHLNTPSAFDGREARALEAIADRVGGEDGDQIRALSNAIRPLTTWYGELLNQIGHAFLGLVSTVLFCAVWREVAGEMPYRSYVFTLVFLSYAIGIELLAQRWQPGDAWFDSLMFTFGAAAALVPFYEVDAYAATTVVEYYHRCMAGIIVLWAGILSFRVYKRIDAIGRQE